MIKISIDFVAGSHGHFLEYMCNRFIADIGIDFAPFKDPYYVENSVFIDSIVTIQLTNIASEHYDPNLLLDIYRHL